MADKSAIEWTDATWNPVPAAQKSVQAVIIAMRPDFQNGSVAYRGIPLKMALI